MDALVTGEPCWELVFDEHGRLLGPDREELVTQVAGSGVADLFVLSHGWNQDAAAARRLYDDLFPLVLEACGGVGTLGPVGFAGVLWPSVWFPETPAHVPAPGGSGQSSAGAATEAASGAHVLSGAEIADSLLPSFTDAGEQQAVREIGALIDRGQEMLRAGVATEAEEEQLIRDLHAVARSLAPAASEVAVEDAGESALFAAGSPTVAYQGLAEVFGSTPQVASVQGVGDWFGKALDGSKDMVRVLSFTIMKARAGTVGATGLGPLLVDLAGGSPHLRVHLVGHSFGARLVSFALSTVGTPESSPVCSLTLLQGAFSHFAFSTAEDNPFGKAGALHEYADRVHGPLVATYSPHDYAVGRWYPKASFLSRDDTQDTSDASRWDGLGGDGFRAVEPLERFALLAQEPTPFALAPGTFYRVDAETVINNVEQSAFSGAHSDIRKVPVARLVAAAAGAHARPPSD